jgi:hypothetical protein
MPISKEPLSVLMEYLPDGSFDKVKHLIHSLNIQLTITVKRETILGNYKFNSRKSIHEISVNGNLNPYSFLITFIHEVAHLITFEQYRHRVDPHGKEWKSQYALLLSEFMNDGIFPNELVAQLHQSLRNPPASSCSDTNLLRILKSYDKIPPTHLEDIEEGKLFRIKDKQTFRKGPKRRTRYECTEILSGKKYLIHGLYEVTRVDVTNTSP